VTSPAAARANKLLRVAYLLVLLFGFLVAIELMSKSIKALTDTGMLGGGGDDALLFGGVTNPFAGLAHGVLFTVLVQSSSTTTATIVAVVGSGVLPVESAVPMVMGANIGTTVTNTLVAIGHVRRSAEFRRAFSAATVHDFFNLMAVGALFPLEVTTGALSRTAHWLTGLLGGSGGAEYKSPIKTAIKTVFKQVEGALEGLGLDGKALGVAMLALGIGLTFLCLIQITRNMRQLLGGRIEQAMNRVLEGSGVVGLGVGTGVTMAVQSSSITTSLLVPMCAAGVMTLESAFPVMLGANIGTTVTALLASLAQENPAALTIALVHVLFNLLSVSVVWTIRPLRRIPPMLARRLANRAAKNRLWVLAYVLGCFVGLPLTGWILWGTAGG
jgi:sodium-dependent phosphate cotransporter